MKIYWENREGIKPPKNATFHFKSFDSKTSISTNAQFIDLPPPQTANVIKKTYLPSYSDWEKSIEKALEKKIPKVVLARSTLLELDTSPDPFAITAALKKKAKNSFIFCIQFDDFSFLGATPERLFKKEENSLLTEAMAGTRKRGKTALEDHLLEKELLNSSKDSSEISPVKHYLSEKLSPLCISPPQFDPFSIYKTSNVQHLYTPCRGRLKENISDDQILNAIHPTPALCGTPKDEAFSFIEEVEPFNRGFYGGALGWSFEEESEWIVAIRSCILQKNQAILYSGTGIVSGSSPQEEWDELNQKIKLFDDIFLEK